MWVILQGLFGFSIFSASDWTRLFHAELRGFAGFVFGILILAAIPIYVATTTLIIRTGKPLFVIPKPKILQFSKPEPTPAPSEPATDTEPAAPATQELPTNLPRELRSAFLRARQNLNSINLSAPASETPQPDQTQQSPASSMPITPDGPAAADVMPAPTAPAIPTPETENIHIGAAAIPPLSDANDAFPIPSDFDFSAPKSSSIPGAPVFSDVTFDNPVESKPEMPPAPSPNPMAENNDLIEFLKSNSESITTDGDIVITDKYAIATHSDPDFWIADAESWFATGKQCPSPVAAAINAAAAHGLRPVLYLAATNILDIDEKRAEWESQGVKIITELPDLLN